MGSRNRVVEVVVIKPILAKFATKKSSQHLFIVCEKVLRRKHKRTRKKSRIIHTD